jgi:hypothetical protein
LAGGEGSGEGEKLARGFLLLLRSATLLLLRPEGTPEGGAGEGDEGEGGLLHLLASFRGCYAALSGEEAAGAAAAEPMGVLAAASLAVAESGGGVAVPMAVRGLREGVRRTWGLVCGSQAVVGVVAVDTLVSAVCGDDVEDEEEEEDEEEDDEESSEEGEEEDEEEEEEEEAAPKSGGKGGKGNGDVLLGSKDALAAVLMNEEDDEDAEATQQVTPPAILVVRSSYSSPLSFHPSLRS